MRDVETEQHVGLHLLHLLDHRGGQRPQASAGAHQDRLRDRQRERQVEIELRALARGGLDLDPATERGDLAAHDVHADAAAGDLRHLRGRREPWLEQAFDELLLGRLGVLRDQADRTGALADAVEIDAAAVVRELDQDFVADLLHGERDLAGLRLAGLLPRVARLEAVVERIAQQVLERADQLFQHRAIELRLRAVDLEVGALVELARGGAHDPVEALGQAAERHRADGEQALLHVARQTRLGEQRGVGVVEIAQQRLLHRRHVVHAFGERARELLEARVTVELERVELVAVVRRARLDLRLRLQLDLAHLAAQPDDAARQLEQVRLERAQLAFDASTRDGDLAGLVHQAVDRIGTNAQHGARAGLDVLRFGARGQAGGRGRRRRAGKRHDGRALRLRRRDASFRSLGCGHRGSGLARCGGRQA